MIFFSPSNFKAEVIRNSEERRQSRQERHDARSSVDGEENAPPSAPASENAQTASSGHMGEFLSARDGDLDIAEY